MDLNAESAFVTMFFSAISAAFSSWATSRKIRSEGDSIVSDAIAKRTEQLFSHFGQQLEAQQAQIVNLQKSLGDCHRQHEESLKAHRDTISRLQALESAVGLEGK